MKIIDNNEKSFQQIFNIGNPENEISIREVALMLINLYQQHPRSKNHPFSAGIKEVSSLVFYGKGYEDVETRTPSIQKIQGLLGWVPRFNLTEAVRLTLEAFLNEVCHQPLQS